MAVRRGQHTSTSRCVSGVRCVAGPPSETTGSTGRSAFRWHFVGRECGGSQSTGARRGQHTPWTRPSMQPA